MLPLQKNTLLRIFQDSPVIFHQKLGISDQRQDTRAQHDVPGQTQGLCEASLARMAVCFCGDFLILLMPYCMRRGREK